MSNFSPAILVHHSDRFYGEALRQAIRATLPRARTSLLHSVADAQRAVDAQAFDLLISALGGTGLEDPLDFIGRWRRQQSGARVLVISGAFSAHSLAWLRRLGVEGVFDTATEPPARFAVALGDVLAGRRHWSKAPAAQLCSTASPASETCRLLTVCEQIALSVLSDGCSDAEAAAALNLSPATIGTIRRHLHRKLGLQHRGDLIRVAAQGGYVQFTPAGVVRPGFAQLFAAYQARRRRHAGGENRPAKTHLPPPGLRAA